MLNSAWCLQVSGDGVWCWMDEEGRLCDGRAGTGGRIGTRGGSPLADGIKDTLFDIGLMPIFIIVLLPITIMKPQ